MITADQLKAGRALVGLKQEDIARASGLSVQTIKRMETVGTERSSAGNVQAVQRAIEQAGVVFEAEGEMIAGGPGVRLARIPGAGG
ncbi:helix-turn-helix domain-containing protein [Rhizobium laguerreae]|uniref:helix-turn-helix domain-containing protein n=1 Tax=Rhizobium laguerreae TaxID=1076926 RepID=UPI00103DC991|nr:helix-turn-helix transcriptional regulator [Rhizobium laguerreae]TBY07327.1 XRE family transcriptional regulator [Rhizobium laguerreae]